jgi:hypothetical protein
LDSSVSPGISTMSQPSFRTESGRGPFRKMWKMPSRFVRYLSNLKYLRRAAKDEIKVPNDRMRGPIIWLGDLRNRKP